MKLDYIILRLVHLRGWFWWGMSTPLVYWTVSKVLKILHPDGRSPIEEINGQRWCPWKMTREHSDKLKNFLGSKHVPCLPSHMVGAQSSMFKERFFGPMWKNIQKKGNQKL